jgi:hypothetical protein
MVMVMTVAVVAVVVVVVVVVVVYVGSGTIRNSWRGLNPPIIIVMAYALVRLLQYHIHILAFDAHTVACLRLYFISDQQKINQNVEQNARGGDHEAVDG